MFIKQSFLHSSRPVEVASVVTALTESYKRALKVKDLTLTVVPSPTPGANDEHVAILCSLEGQDTIPHYHYLVTASYDDTEANKNIESIDPSTPLPVIKLKPQADIESIILNTDAPGVEQPKLPLEEKKD